MAEGIDRLIEIMARLRDPAGGCPWDLEQTFRTIAPYTIEESYEVADAIDRDDMEELRDELGDLLLQVVFHAQMARERGAFAFADVVEAICDKLIRRHPHVFADERVDTAQAQTARWEEHKARERNRRLPTAADGGGDRPGGDEAGALDGVPRALPALLRAAKLQKRAALVGFDWPDAEAPLAKFAEESRELADEMAAGAGIDRLRDELGDLLFTAVNVARKLAIDPEQALRQANDKFERRFRRIEAMLREDGGRRPADAGLVELDALWERAKANE